MNQLAHAVSILYINKKIIKSSNTLLPKLPSSESYI